MRVSALKYLALLPNIVRYDVLHPYKAMVVRELAKVLDDPRRIVRKEAVEARWMRRATCVILFIDIFYRTAW